MRTIEYYDELSTTWSGIAWGSVVSGTKIRIHEEDGTPVLDGTGVHEFMTASDSYLSVISGSEDVWTVQTYDPDPYPVPKQAE
jgi:hypothetical protein